VRKGQVIGLQLPSDSDEEQAPWERSPSGRIPVQQIKGKLPKRVTAVLAQRIFVEKKGLPAPLINRIKRLAAFQNPEFYKKQKMRLSTNSTPRVIACFEELPEHVALPFSWKGMLVQYAGRLHRLHSGKEEVQVYDYVDGSVSMLVKMHEKRMKGFRTLGYEQEET